MDLKQYSAWPRDDSGRCRSDLSCFLRRQPAVDALGIQHHPSRTSGVTLTSDTFHEGSGAAADINQQANAVKPVSSASAKAAQTHPQSSQEELSIDQLVIAAKPVSSASARFARTKPQASQEISSHIAVPAPAHIAATASVSVLQPPAGAPIASLEHALDGQTPTKLGKLNAQSVPPLQHQTAPDRHLAVHHSRVSCPERQQQTPAAATAQDLAGEGARQASEPAEKPAQPEASLQIDMHTDQGQDAQSMVQQEYSLLSPLTLADDPCELPQANAVPRDPSAMTSPPAKQKHVAGDKSSPNFQLSPAIAAAMNPNNPAFDPAIRDSWKAAMAYQRLAARGKGTGQASRRGPPQKHSNLSRQDHAFFLENAGMLSDSS